MGFLARQHSSSEDNMLQFTLTAYLQYFPLAPFARSYRVTDEAFIAET